MKKILVRFISILSVAVFLFTGCSGNSNSNSSDTTNNSEVDVSVNITDSTLAMDCFDSYAFELKLENTDNVTWTSSDSSILSIDENGTATTNIKEGKVTVTAKSGDVSDTCEVTVLRKKELPTFVVENDVTISEGDSYALSLYLYYDGKDITEYVTFGCDAMDETQETVVATVSGNEVLFTGNALGEAEYTVYTTIYGQLLAERVDVTVKNTDLVYLLDGAVDNQLCLTSSHEVYTSDIHLYYKGERVSIDSTEWNVFDETIVTIGEGGKLLAGKEGVTNLTLRYQGVDVSVAVRVIKDRISVTVEQEEAEFINLDTLITATQITYPTDGLRTYEINESNTDSFALNGAVTEGEIMAKYILDFTEKYNMTFPGWEPERMAKLDELFKAYAPVTKEKLWENLKYFLEAIMPTCRECDIKMAIHMDDPPWDIFGLPRLLVDEPSIDRFLKMVDDEYNCLTLCSGSLNANPNNNVTEIVRKHCDRIAFAHIRNVKHFPNGDFSEASHRDCDGDTGILDILKAYHDCGFNGYIRPDHGRHLWDEGPGKVRPGYGLYDRALGIMYMLGVWDMLDRLEEQK